MFVVAVGACVLSGFPANTSNSHAQACSTPTASPGGRFRACQLALNPARIGNTCQLDLNRLITEAKELSLQSHNVRRYMIATFVLVCVKGKQHDSQLLGHRIKGCTATRKDWHFWSACKGKQNSFRIGPSQGHRAICGTSRILQKIWLLWMLYDNPKNINHSLGDPSFEETSTKKKTDTDS